ncbi:MAG: hypothetical protein J6V50_05705 [Clostridia bacterium]|nr:hypothetical protein [Clostridia bacterium]
MNNNDFKNIIQNSDPEKLKASLSADEQALLNTLLNDKSAREKFLSSAEAQKLLKMLGKI